MANFSPKPRVFKSFLVEHSFCHRLNLLSTLSSFNCHSNFLKFLYAGRHRCTIFHFREALAIRRKTIPIPLHPHTAWPKIFDNGKKHILSILGQNYYFEIWVEKMNRSSADFCGSQFLLPSSQPFKC